MAAQKKLLRDLTVSELKLLRYIAENEQVTLQQAESALDGSPAIAAVRAALTSMTASEIVEVLRESAGKHVRIAEGKATPESAGRACGEFLTTIKYRKLR